ncbi:MAG: CZB domain-containing protein [Gammaproteobacteria bacterium]|nr:CZB domain-containing protein [Gammaproteobacteria bacterium]MBU1646260.1 CZB domain-containing protein [Gammaproteobacteria bacterium]MBU1971186.1 CZB domain-containing protein [Gammaproteobacteria bacterium]
MGMKSEIDQAIEAHAAWRKRFKDFLNGRGSFDAATVGANDQCQFGKWLNNEGYRLMPSTVHDDIRTAHDEFHRVAAGIVQKIKDKKFAEAGQDLAPDGAFNEVSKRLTGHLLKASLREPAKPGAATDAAAPAAPPPAGEPTQ